MTTLAFIILSLVVIIQCAPKTFHNDKVLRLDVSELDDIHWLADQYENNRDLDFWIEPFALGNVDVRVTSSVYDNFTHTITERGIPFSTLIENVQELIDQQMIRHTEAFSLTQYNTLEDIQAWLRTLPSEFPNFVDVVNFGESYEGRQLLGVRITTGRTTKPKALWYDGGIHAREWISPATVLYMTYKLLTDYSTDPEVKTILDNSEVFVLPVFNVDGYSYTFSDDRLWRKTRRPNPGSICVGTDPNRNWGFQFGGLGTSTDPCAENYRGPKAFSEVEVEAVANYLRNYGKFVGYINFHSYSQLWLSPWGYSGNLPADYDAQNSLSGACVAALTGLYGTRYTYGPTYSTIYPASGVSNDYTYGQLRIVFSYAPELRDTGNYGFLLPANQIQPSGEETFLALKTWALKSIAN